MPRFEETYCSQCGKSLGPGDSGVSHCDEHWRSSPSPTREELVEAIRQLLYAHPVFRSKPMGGPGSIARASQDEAIRAEDHARALVSQFDAQGEKYEQ